MKTASSCDERCWTAREPVCMCSCGGRNHGTGPSDTDSLFRKKEEVNTMQLQDGQGLLIDQILKWRGFGEEATRGFHNGSWESRCRLRIYRRGEQCIIIFTESREDEGAYLNPGTSITNSSQNIATMVVRDFGLLPATTVWIEHYEAGHGIEETFDRVKYVWDGLIAKTQPRWSHLGRDAAEQLVGARL